MTPSDLSATHAIAIALVLILWFAYGAIFKLLGKGSLNAQLAIVRRQWINQIPQREGKPFDAILLGHIVHSVAFFGSATLIVLAGVFSIIVNLESIHGTLTRLHFVSNVSLELFAIEYALIALVLTICFFSFTYALRKLVYAIALIGALPDHCNDRERLDCLIDDATTVLSEALKTFNFGIRGYYYAIAGLFLFISPLACIITCCIVTAILIYRQIGSNTSRAITSYIKASERVHRHRDN
jgi:uncharacterized membrane protein